MHKRVLGIMSLLFLLSVFVPIGTSLAESLDVSAQVHAPLPPTGETPIVQAPGDNSTVEVQNVFITGQCYIIDPSLIVVLLRDNQTIGTGPCLPDGTFRILVGLVKGANVIIPKYVTITGQSSGFGLPITLTYFQAVTSIEPTPQNSTTIPVAEALKIALHYDFVTYNDTSPTEITYTVSGGNKPYLVTINWGDGTQTTAKVSNNDPQTSKHQYDSVLPPSALTITAVDSTGQKAVQSRGLVSFKKGLYVPAAAPLKDEGIFGASTAKKIWAGVASISILALLINHFGYTQFIITKTTPSTTLKKMHKKVAKH